MRSLSIALFASVAMAGTTDDNVPDSRYIKYAEGFAPYTVRIRVASGDKVTAAGTATLIGDHWALTAAHVVEGGGEVTVRDLTAAEVFIHEEFGPGRADIALVRTDRPFGLAFYPPLSDGEEAVGDVVSLAGYGITGRMSAGHSLSDDRLRAGTQTIERLEDEIVVCKAQHRSSVLEFLIAPGDSGGPLFCRGKLAGIHSMTMAPRGPLRSRVGEESGHTRVSVFRAWIRKIMEGR